MPVDLETVDLLVTAGKYTEAVQLLRSIADDPAAPSQARVDAFQFLGTMTKVDPSAMGEDFALPYFQRALQLKPDHLWALQGIVATFGDHAPDHQDKAALLFAAERLLARANELPQAVVSEVRQRLERFHAGPPGADAAPH
ncbi:MAG TPA: hypothetical protein VFV87_01935 [Pirellulaceae bacterium]|nr:hypothetical protein [Pirellulaceae bacterium]